jgi:hypothetical protein
VSSRNTSPKKGGGNENDGNTSPALEMDMVSQINAKINQHISAQTSKDSAEENPTNNAEDNSNNTIN